MTIEAIELLDQETLSIRVGRLFDVLRAAGIDTVLDGDLINVSLREPL